MDMAREIGAIQTSRLETESYRAQDIGWLSTKGHKGRGGFGSQWVENFLRSWGCRRSSVAVLVYRTTQRRWRLNIDGTSRVDARSPLVDAFVPSQVAQSGSESSQLGAELLRSPFLIRLGS